MADYDLIVIGGGPGGYVAAIRAAQLGMKTICVERESFGGICLNWGCIPTKALLRSAEVLELCRNAAAFGVKIEGTVSFDFPSILKRSRKIAETQEKGVLSLFKKYGVEPLRGSARLLGGGKVAVKKNEGGDATLAGKHILVATGARAKSLPGVTIDGKKVIEYRGALSLPAVPKSMVVIGAGAIGVEFASFYQALGVDITLVEYMPSLVPLEDDEIAKELERSFKKRKIRMLTGTQVTGVATGDAGVKVSVQNRTDPQKKEEIAAEIALMAVGIAANVEEIGLDVVGAKVDKGFVVIDERTYQTTAKGVYAIGDISGPPALAHTASAEAIVCVERIAGKDPILVDYDSIPACTFCHPEIGSIGLTEKQAKELGVPVKVGHFPFIALGKARALGDTEGFVKVLYHAEDGRLVGAHIIGPNASDLIAEYGLAKSTEVNAESLIHTIHAHPTLAEALKEASEQAYGHAIHI